MASKKKGGSPPAKSPKDSPLASGAGTGNKGGKKGSGASKPPGAKPASPKPPAPKPAAVQPGIPQPPPAPPPPKPEPPTPAPAPPENRPPAAGAATSIEEAPPPAASGVSSAPVAPPPRAAARAAEPGAAKSSAAKPSTKPVSSSDSPKTEPAAAAPLPECAVEEGSPLRKFADRWAFVCVASILALLPFVAFLPLRIPVRGQSYFLKIATFTGLAVHLILVAAAPAAGAVWTIPKALLLAGSASVLLSAAASPAAAYSLNSSLLWFAGLALHFLARSGFRRRDPLAILGGVFLFQAGALSAYGIAQHYGFELLPYSGNVQKNRVIATFGHPNYFGSYMAPLAFLCLAAGAATRNRAFRWTAAGAALLTAGALALARTRAAWIGAGAGLALAAGFASILRPSLGRRIWTNRPLRFAALAAMLGCAALAASMGFARFKSAARLEAGSQWENRIYYWYTALGMRSPWSPLGTGHGGFGRNFWDQADRQQASPEGRLFHGNMVALTGRGGAIDPDHPHNDYIEMWVESGPVALAAHLAFLLFLVFFQAMRIRRLSRLPETGDQRILSEALLIGGLVCVAVDGLFGFPLALPCSLALFWFLSAILANRAEEAVP